MNSIIACLRMQCEPKLLRWHLITFIYSREELVIPHLSCSRAGSLAILRFLSFPPGLTPPRAFIVLLFRDSLWHYKRLHLPWLVTTTDGPHRILQVAIFTSAVDLSKITTQPRINVFICKRNDARHRLRQVSSEIRP